MEPQRNGYAVVWREGDGPPATGKLVVEEDGVRLEGSSRGRLLRRRLPFDRLAGVRIGRDPSERLNGRPTVVLERPSASTLFVEPLGAGLLSEVSDLIAGLSSAWSDRLEQVAVIVPLREGALERARALVAGGPPFDLADAGLERHYVFFSEQEVVFVFDGPNTAESVGQLLGRPELWRAGAEWAECLAGPPRLAEAGYAWPATAAAH